MPSFAHYYDRKGSRKVCQVYERNVLSQGNHFRVTSVSGHTGTTLAATERM